MFKRGQAGSVMNRVSGEPFSKEPIAMGASAHAPSAHAPAKPQAARASSAKAPAAKRDAAGKYVCPFCGNVNASADDACPRCTMENTPVTRQATRARIGPWYVLQSRNPSAPGMKFSTLLSLIRKGQVTAKSIVRGPTTHQLWRFAARVRGLSREFGVCHACGMDVEKTAAVCGHCSRSQEPPPNPDVLLDLPDARAPRSPVFREVAPPAVEAVADAEVVPEAAHAADAARPAGTTPSNAPATREAAAPPEVEAAAYNAPDADSDVSDAVVVDEPSAPLADRPAERRGAVNGGKPPAEPARRQPAKPMLSAQELAAAFSLEYDPAKVPGVPRRGGAGRLMVGLSAVALGAAGVLVYMTPSVRDPMVDWGKRTLALATRGAPSAAVGGTLPDVPDAAPTPARPNKPFVLPQSVVEAQRPAKPESHPQPTPDTATPAPAPTHAVAVAPARKKRPPRRRCPRPVSSPPPPRKRESRPNPRRLPKSRPCRPPSARRPSIRPRWLPWFLPGPSPTRLPRRRTSTPRRTPTPRRRPCRRSTCPSPPPRPPTPGLT